MKKSTLTYPSSATPEVRSLTIKGELDNAQSLVESLNAWLPSTGEQLLLILAEPTLRGYPPSPKTRSWNVVTLKQPRKFAIINAFEVGNGLTRIEFIDGTKGNMPVPPIGPSFDELCEEAERRLHFYETVSVHGARVNMSQNVTELSIAQRAELREKLEQHFNKEELRTLCFDLGITYEDLPDTREGMARELVAYCERRGIVPRLLSLCREKRPNAEWPAMPTAPERTPEPQPTLPVEASSAIPRAPSEALRAIPPEPPASKKNETTPHTTTPPLSPCARRIGQVMISLVVLDIVLALVLAWRLFGNEPNVLAYMQAMTGVLALVLQIVGLFIALGVRHIALRNISVEIGKRNWLCGFIMVMTVVLVSFLVAPVVGLSAPSAVPPSIARSTASPTVTYTNSPVPSPIPTRRTDGTPVSTSGGTLTPTPTNTPTPTEALITKPEPGPSGVVPIPINTILPQSPQAISIANAANVRQVKLIEEHSGQTLWSPDGQYLATLSGGINLYDAKTFRLVRTIGRDQHISSFAFFPDGDRLVTAGDSVIIWQVDSGGQSQVFNDLKNVKGVAVSPDRKLLAVGIDQVVKLVDIANGSEEATLTIGHTDANPAFSTDGKQLAMAGGIAGQEILIFDVATGKKVTSLTGHSNWIKQVVYSADGLVLVSASVDQTVRVWNATNGLLLTTLAGHTGEVDGVAISPNGKIVASISWDLTMKLWNAGTGQVLNSLTGHTEWGSTIAFSPDGATVASGDFGQAVRVWGLPAGKSATTRSNRTKSGPIPTPVPLSTMAISPENVNQLKQLAVSDNLRVSQIVFAPDGRQFAIASGRIYFFEPRTLRQLPTVLPEAQKIAYSPDGRLLASASYDGIKLLQVSSGGELMTFAGSKGSKSVAFSPDGSLVASVSGQSVKLWDAASGEELTTVPAGPSQANVAFSPDGRLLAAASGHAGQEIKVWDANSWQEVYTLKGHSNWISKVIFSPDSQTLASSASDNSIRIWDMKTGLMTRNIPIPKERSNQIPDLAFSPNGRLLASTYGIPLVSIWDVASGNELRTLDGPTTMVKAVAFSPDGTYLVTGEDVLRVWSIAQ